MTNVTVLPSAGDLLGRTFSRLGRRWAMPAALVFVGLLFGMLAWGLVFAAALAVLWFTKGPELLERVQANPDALGYLMDDPVASLSINLLAILGMLVAFRIYATFVLAAIHASADDGLGFWKCVSLAKPRTWSFIGALLLQSLAVHAATLLLILPGIWLGVRLNLTLIAHAREGLGPIASLKRSFEATAGHFWAVLGRVLLLGLVSGLIMIVPIAGWIAGTSMALIGLVELGRDLGIGTRVERGGR